MGTLHVVATPIGNLEDVTLRALRVLREADLVLAEDTRRTRILLDRHGIVAKPRSLHAHNEAARSEEALAALRAGSDVALVSDAGTPLVSDPGARLVAAAAEAGHGVVSIPGPSAVLAALTVSGLASDRFAFLGFLPRRDAARRALLRRHAALPGPLVLFESPRRVAATLRLLREELGDRAACVARELTKIHEEALRAPLSALEARLAKGARGEITIVVAGAGADAGEARPAEPAPAEPLDVQIRALLAAGRSPREIASGLARSSGLPRRAVYARALALRDGP
jgi:16S rRNA (cytidine1402-2'-O)-methyltransferase